MSRVTRQQAEDAADALAREMKAFNEARVAFEAERNEQEQRTAEEAAHIQREREAIASAHAALQAEGERQQEALTVAAEKLRVKLAYAEQAAQTAGRPSSSPASTAAGSSSPTVSQGKPSRHSPLSTLTLLSMRMEHSTSLSSLRSCTNSRLLHPDSQ